MLSTGHKFYGVLLADRERDNVAYVVHERCAARLHELTGGDPINGQRLVEMGPGTSDPADVCHFGPCARPMGEGAAS